MKLWKEFCLIVACSVIAIAAGCSNSEPAPNPSASAAAASNKQKALDNPTVPEDIKRQMRGAGAPK